MTKDKTNIEEIKEEQGKVATCTHYMGWENFGEGYWFDTCSLCGYINGKETFKDYIPKDQVQAECEKYLDEFIKVSDGKIPETTDYANGWNDCRRNHYETAQNFKNFKKEQREHER